MKNEEEKADEEGTSLVKMPKTMEPAGEDAEDGGTSPMKMPKTIERW